MAHSFEEHSAKAQPTDPALLTGIEAAFDHKAKVEVEGARVVPEGERVLVEGGVTRVIFVQDDETEGYATFDSPEELAATVEEKGADAVLADCRKRAQPVLN